MSKRLNNQINKEVNKPMREIKSRYFNYGYTMKSMLFPRKIFYIKQENKYEIFWGGIKENAKRLY